MTCSGSRRAEIEQLLREKSLLEAELKPLRLALGIYVWLGKHSERRVKA